MKRMLFNATHAEELRVAIVDGQKLIDIDIESAGRESRKSNIYKGVVTRLEPSLEACFVDYGEDRQGFLPLKEISRSFFKPSTESPARLRIQDLIEEGQELTVQMDKEERGGKGAALTTFISLAGRYLVLMPNNPRGGGVSRRIEGDERQELREAMEHLTYPPGMSLIARTAGIGRSTEELQWDLNYLLQLWQAIDNAAQSGKGAFLIYQESSLVIRAIRDYFVADIGEILVDTPAIYEQARQFMGHVMPDMVSRVKHYQDDVPLFSRFQVEKQIETARSREVSLISGGSIVFDPTEALLSVDVNSAKSTRGTDIEETALSTNLEAADEVARQLRLRDIGGLVAIDFIDMDLPKNQREVEKRLREALHYDRARVQLGKICIFGVMMLTRQRLRPSLNEGTHVTCPRCTGTGLIRDTESSALHVLRLVEEEALKGQSAALICQVPLNVANYLFNEKLHEVQKIGVRHDTEIVLLANPHLETPHYKLERIRHDSERAGLPRASYLVADGPSNTNSYLDLKLQPTPTRQKAVVQGVTQQQPPPMVGSEPLPKNPSAGQLESGLGFIVGRVLGWFRSRAANEASARPASPAAPLPGSGNTPKVGDFSLTELRQDPPGKPRVGGGRSADRFSSAARARGTTAEHRAGIAPAASLSSQGTGRDTTRPSGGSGPQRRRPGGTLGATDVAEGSGIHSSSTVDSNPLSPSKDPVAGRRPRPVTARPQRGRPPINRIQTPEQSEGEDRSVETPIEQGGQQIHTGEPPTQISATPGPPPLDTFREQDHAVPTRSAGISEKNRTNTHGSLPSDKENVLTDADFPRKATPEPVAKAPSVTSSSEAPDDASDAPDGHRRGARYPRRRATTSHRSVTEENGQPLLPSKNVETRGTSPVEPTGKSQVGTVVIAPQPPTPAHRVGEYNQVEQTAPSRSSVGSGGIAEKTTSRKAPGGQSLADVPPPLSLEKLGATVSSAGLEWVETNFSPPSAPKAAAIQPRPHRVRKPRPSSAAEGLVQIETAPKTGPEGG